MLNKFKQFIYNIQNAEDNIKKRWLVILSGGTMLIVVALWVTYFNLTTVQVSSPEVGAEAITKSDSPSRLDSLRQTLATGISVVKERLGKEKNITIDTTERNFILESVEPITKTILP